MLQRLETKLPRSHRSLIQLHACRTIALDAVLDPHEYLGIHRLRTRVAAEQSPGDCRKEKQRICRNDQQQGEIEDILRPQDKAEQIKLALDKMKQYCLTAIPLKPRRTVKQNLRDPNQNPAPRIPPPLYIADIYLFVFLIKRNRHRSRQRSGRIV